MTNAAGHRNATLQALLVTFLWSTSWVLIKWGLVAIPALTFAGLRYGLAFLCLLPFALGGRRRAALGALGGGDWARLLLLGLLFYALTQGAQFVALAHLPAITVNLVLAFSVLAVAAAGRLLGERTSRGQWLGVALAGAGAVLYFGDGTAAATSLLGLAAAAVALLSNAGSSLLGRAINRRATIPPLVVTTLSMGIGAVILLGTGLAVDGLPSLDRRGYLIVAWLAVVNTAVAFTLWNHTLRRLSALESSMINNTMGVQIPLLAILVLGERPSAWQALGLVSVAAGAAVVQLEALRRGSASRRAAECAGPGPDRSCPDR